MSKLAKGLAIGGAGLGTALSFGAASPALAGALGGLGLGGATGGAVAGALGTAGNVLGKVGGTASNVGQVAGGAGSGLTEQRLREAEINSGMVDRNRLDRSQQQVTQNINRDSQALERAKLGISAPMDRAKQAAYGDAIHNVQDVNLDFAPKTGSLPKFNISGGLRPSMFGANARGAGDELSRQALMAIMNKSDVPGASPLVDMPEIGGYTHAGAGEKVLQGTGLVGGLIGAASPVLDLLKKRQPMPTMADMPGAPNLSRGDVAYGQGQSPQLLPLPNPNDFYNPNRLRATF